MSINGTSTDDDGVVIIGAHLDRFVFYDETYTYCRLINVSLVPTTGHSCLPLVRKSFGLIEDSSNNCPRCRR